MARWMEEDGNPFEKQVLLGRYEALTKIEEFPTPKIEELKARISDHAKIVDGMKIALKIMTDES